MKKIFCLLFALLLMSGCSSKTYVTSRDYSYMDTLINVKIYDKGSKIDDALDHIDEMYKQYDHLSDRYTEYEGVNNVYYINHAPLHTDIVLDWRLYYMIQYSESYYEKTNKLFNIALGNAVDVWKSYRDGNKQGLPSINELKASGTSDLSSLTLKGYNIIMKRGDISLDLGAIAKGYATEAVGKYLENNGINNYLITAGTSSIKAGSHYDGNQYKIGLIDPKTGKDVYKVINGSNIAVTTSGSYERYYEYEGKRYGHIIDPNTLYPSNYMSSVTVITEDASLGEVLSTTLFLMPIDKGLEYIKQFNGVEAIWYGNDGEITLSDGMSKYE